MGMMPVPSILGGKVFRSSKMQDWYNLKISRTSMQRRKFGRPGSLVLARVGNSRLRESGRSSTERWVPLIP